MANTKTTGEALCVWLRFLLIWTLKKIITLPLHRASSGKWSLRLLTIQARVQGPSEQKAVSGVLLGCLSPGNSGDLWPKDFPRLIF